MNEFTLLLISGSPLIVLGIVVAVFIIGRGFVVHEEQAVIIERFGKFNRVVGPGLHFMWPFIERKRKFIDDGKLLDFVDQRERTIVLPIHVVTTKDNVQIQIDSIAYYEIADPKKAIYGIDDVLAAVNKLILTVLRNVIADVNLKDILIWRQEIVRWVRDQLENATGDWGIIIRTVELKTITDVSRQSQERYSYWAEEIRHSLLTANKVNLSNKFSKDNQSFISKQFLKDYEHLNLIFDPDTGILEVSERERLEKFGNAWENAKESVETNKTKIFQAATNTLTTLLCEALAFELLDASASYGQLYGRMLDASNPAFQLNIRPEFPIIYLGKTTFIEKDIYDIAGLLTQLKIYAEYFALLIVFASNVREIRRQVNDSAYKNDFIVLSHEQFWEILSAKSPIQRLIYHILEQIDLLAVSPYTVAGPVRSKIFLGRTEEEKTLLQGISRNNYLLLANRKIGKTSLLNRIEPRLRKDPRYKVFYIDLQNVIDYVTFYKKLERSRYPEFQQEFDKIQNISPLEFAKFMRTFHTRYKNKQIILIFDEVDALLAYDLEYEEALFKTFRSLSQQENTHFIFSGTKTLVERVRDPNSPFFNFCEEIKLGLLEKEAAHELISAPMRTLGVKFEDETTIVNRILTITAQHPNMIQYTCSELIKIINKKQKRII